MIDWKFVAVRLALELARIGHNHGEDCPYEARAVEPAWCDDECGREQESGRAYLTEHPAWCWLAWAIRECDHIDDAFFEDQ